MRIPTLTAASRENRRILPEAGGSDPDCIVFVACVAWQGHVQRFALSAAAARVPSNQDNH